VVTVVGILSLIAAGEIDPDRVAFFETSIRPLLVERCLECHGPKKQKGGLRLDSRAGWMQGGDSGPAIVPGDPDASLLVRAVRRTDPKLRMPPDRRLTDRQVALLEEWVRTGAADPRGSPPDSGAASTALRPEDASSHWAYRPPVRRPPPDVRRSEWRANGIDRFVLAGLEARGLLPAAEADGATLIRRLYYDLAGLPPPLEEIDAFLSGARDGAWERLVDRLLASPRFGERFGRHWLDVARFAESVTLRGFVFHEAWRYRDYVIEAFNDDLPYDRFVAEQVAGDLLPSASWQERQRQTVATTFLVLGNTNFEEQDKRQLEMDVVDEQLDTIGKAFLAQTIGCARCHDHKFDSIPTRDYYALAGILRSATALVHDNVSKWIEVPLAVDPEEEAILARHEDGLQALRRRLQDAKERAAALAKAASAAKDSGAPAVVAAADLPGVVVDSREARAVGEWRLSRQFPRYIGDGYLHDLDAGKGLKSLTFHTELLRPGRYEVRFAFVPGDNRARKVPITTLHADGETTIEVDQQLEPTIAGRFVKLGEFRFEQANQGYVIVTNDGTRGHVTADAVQFLPLDAPAATAGAPLAAADKAPRAAERAATPGQAPSAEELSELVRELETELKRRTESGPRRPMVMAVREGSEPRDLRVHIRGSVHSLGELAPRGFLQAVTFPGAPSIPPGESGRRQLAEWLSSPSNPLTARVMANRVWQWLFGAGISRTPDNFGTTGEPPSHPELLDVLAIDLVDDGWSVKRLVREIVLSRTYRLASDAEMSQAAGIDPENRFLSRRTRRRLDAESIRDAILAVSGELRLDAHGPTVDRGRSADYGYVHTEPCRSVYVPVLRNALPEIFEVFDYPDPSTVTGQRSTSTVAPQALFLTNHPFILEQSTLAARRLLGETIESDVRRVEQVFWLALGRPPAAAETAIAVAFVSSGGGEAGSTAGRVEAWARVVQALIASPDFRYVD
jgi:hypothetical protein